MSRGKVNNLNAQRKAYGRMPVKALPIDKCIVQIKEELTALPTNFEAGNLYLSPDGSALHLRASGMAQHQLMPFKRTMDNLTTKLPWLKEGTVEFGTEESLAKTEFDESKWLKLETPTYENNVPDTDDIIAWAKENLTKIPPKGPQNKTYYTHIQGLSINPETKHLRIIANLPQYEVDRKLAKQYLSEISMRLKSQYPEYRVTSQSVMPHSLTNIDMFQEGHRPLWLQ